VGTSRDGASFQRIDSDSLPAVRRSREAILEDLRGNEILEETVMAGAAEDRIDEIRDTAPLMTPAKRAALEALEREFRDLLQRT
jgi:hypothetical protein